MRLSCDGPKVRYALVVRARRREGSRQTDGTDGRREGGVPGALFSRGRITVTLEPVKSDASLASVYEGRDFTVRPYY